VSTLEPYRKLAGPPVLGATTAFRMGMGHLGVWTNRLPRLMAIGVEAWEPRPEADEAVDTFWQELIQATRDSTEAALQELERGIADLGVLADERPPRAPRRARQPAARR
jgi:hypothetical protein